MKELNPRFSFLHQRNDWFKIFLLGVLIALGVALWPSAICALGQCNERAQWCNGDCSQACVSSSGVTAVVACFGVPGGGCFEVEDQIGTRCDNGDDCNVTWVESLASRYSISGGYSYWAVGKCEWAGCTLNTTANTERVDCCGDAVVEPPCVSSFSPPKVTLASTTPKYPLVYSQDPQKSGVTVNISVSSGEDLGGCGNTVNLTRVNLEDVSLSSNSIAWITTTLADRYPGAKVLDTYPKRPNFGLHPALSTVATTLSFHFNALDPGYYNATVTATQSDGKVTRAVIQFPVYLLDSTITLP